MGFGNLGIWEMLIIGLLVLIVFGPRRLPEIARSMGKALREFKRGVNEIQRELEEAERGARLREPSGPGPSTEGPRVGEGRVEPPSAGDREPTPGTSDGPDPEPARPGSPAPEEEAGSGPDEEAGSGPEERGAHQADLFGKGAEKGAAGP